MLPTNVMSFMRKIVMPNSNTAEDEVRKSKMTKLKETFTSGIPMATVYKGNQQMLFSLLSFPFQWYSQGGEGSSSSRSQRATNFCHICRKILSANAVFNLCSECQRYVCEDCSDGQEVQEIFICSSCRRKLASQSRAEEAHVSPGEQSLSASPTQEEEMEATGGTVREEQSVRKAATPERDKPKVTVESEVSEHRQQQMSRRLQREDNIHDENTRSGEGRERRQSLSRPSREEEPRTRTIERRLSARDLHREEMAEKGPSSAMREKLGVPEKERRASDVGWTRIAVPEKERRPSDVWDRMAPPEQEVMRRHSSSNIGKVSEQERRPSEARERLNIAQDKERRASESRISVPDKERRASEARISVPDKERRASEARISVPDKERRPSEARISVPDKERRASEARISVPDKERRPSDVRMSVPDKERRPSDARISVPDKERRPSDVRERMSVPEKGERRFSECRIMVLESDRHPERHMSEDWDRGLAPEKERDRRHSEAWEKMTVPERERRPSESREKMSVPERERRPSETREKIVVPEKERRPSESREMMMPPEKERRPSECREKMMAPEKERRPSESWVGPEMGRRSSDSWDMPPMEQERRSSDTWDRSSESERRMSDTWERMSSLDFGRRPSDTWDRLPVPELIVRRLSDTGPAREIQIPEQPRRLSDTGPPREHFLIVPDRRLSEFISLMGERAPGLERRLSEVGNIPRRTPQRGRRMSEVVLTLDGAFLLDRSKYMDSISPAERPERPPLDRRPSEVTRFWTRGGMRHRGSIDSGEPLLERSSLSMDVDWGDLKERRLSDYEPPRDNIERRPSDLAAAWEKGSQSRRQDWQGGEEGSRMVRPPSLRYTLSDSLHDSFESSSRHDVRMSPRGSMTSCSSGSEIEEGERGTEWKRKRSRTKRRPRNNHARNSYEDEQSPPRESKQGSSRISRHFSWDKQNFMQRRRSSGSSELSDTGPDVLAPPIPPRKDSQVREGTFRPNKLHHHSRQRSIRKQPPAIFVDDGDDMEQPPTMESSPSPDMPSGMHLLRRQSRGDTRAVSDSEATRDLDMDQEAKDLLLKPRRSWPEAVPKTGFEPGGELHHGHSLLNMLRSNPPPGGFVIPRQPASGVPHELDDTYLQGDYENIRIVIDDVDDFTARSEHSSVPVRRIVLHRDSSDSQRTHGLGMRVVGGKVDTNGHLYTYVVWTVKDGLADKAGIATGDRILSWDDESLVDRTFEEVNTIIERSADSVVLLVERPLPCSTSESVERSSSWVSKGKVQDSSADTAAQSYGSSRRKLPKIPMAFSKTSAMGQVQIQVWYDREKQELVVTVIGCRGLPMRPSSSDQMAPQAYLKLQLILQRETKSFKTKLTEPSFNPTWNEVFVFACTTPDDIADGHLQITVWDYYQEGSTEFLGETEVYLNKVNLDDQPTWFKLHEHRRRSNPLVTAHPPSQPPPPHEETGRSARARRRSMRRAEFQHSRSLSDEMSDMELLEPSNSIVKSSSVDWTRMLHPDQAWDRGRRRSSSSSAGEHSEPCRPPSHVTPNTTTSGPPQMASMTDTEEASTSNRSRNRSFKFSRQDTLNGGSRHRRKFSQRMKKLSRSLSLKSSEKIKNGSGAGTPGESGPKQPSEENEQEWVPEFLVSPPGTSSSKWKATSSLDQSDEGSEQGNNKEEQQSNGSDNLGLSLGPGQVIPRGLMLTSKPDEQETGEILLGFLMSKGQLEVQVIAGRGLSLNPLGQPPDTYVKTYLKQGERRIQKKKTRVVRHSTEPQYQQTLRYSGCDVLGRTLLVMVWERQKGFDHNQGLGMAQIQLDQLDLTKHTEAWYTLYSMAKLVSDSDST